MSDDDVRHLLATPTVTTAGLPSPRHKAATAIRAITEPAPNGVPAREVLEEVVGNARIVLIGEGSHGTHEFYKARADITRWLIEEKDSPESQPRQIGQMLTE